MVILSKRRDQNDDVMICRSTNDESRDGRASAVVRMSTASTVLYRDCQEGWKLDWRFNGSMYGSAGCTDFFIRYNFDFNDTFRVLQWLHVPYNASSRCLAFLRSLYEVRLSPIRLMFAACKT
jgi:hypothetical protein